MKFVVGVALREWLTGLETHLYKIIKNKGILEILSQWHWWIYALQIMKWNNDTLVI